MSTETVEYPTSTEAPCVRFKRAGKDQDKKWVLEGPVDQVTEGPVTVTLKSGKAKVVDVVGVGKSFMKDGILQRYGYQTKEEEPAPATTAAAAAADLSDLDFPPTDFEPAPDQEDPFTW